MKKIILALLVVLLVDCKKNEFVDPDPNKAILGKWEPYYLGNGEDRPPLIPTGSREFLPDSLLLEYAYDTKKTYTKKYWIDSRDTVLFIGTLREDGYLLTFQFKYKFYGNTMELTRHNAIFIQNVSRYKRIK